MKKDSQKITSEIINVIIPAFNEAGSIAKVIHAIPNFVEEIIVVNNGSTDATATVAKQAGASVLTEKQKGYGYACLKGMEYIASKTKLPDIIVFLDGDFSEYAETPEDLRRLNIARKFLEAVKDLETGIVFTKPYQAPLRMAFNGKHVLNHYWIKQKRLM